MMAVTVLDTGYTDVAVGKSCRIEQQPELEQGVTEGAVIVSIAGMQLQRSNSLALL